MGIINRKLTIFCKNRRLLWLKVRLLQKNSSSDKWTAFIQSPLQDFSNLLTHIHRWWWLFHARIWPNHWHAWINQQAWLAQAQGLGAWETTSPDQTWLLMFPIWRSIRQLQTEANHLNKHKTTRLLIHPRKTGIQCLNSTNNHSPFTTGIQYFDS